MAKFNGYGGGFGGGNNMQQLMRQAQQMQKKLAEAQKELAESEVVATSAGDMVEVVMGCDRTLTSIKIKPEAVDPDDVEMLEDMIKAAFNKAMELVEEEQQRVMGPLTGGAGGLGGLF